MNALMKARLDVAQLQAAPQMMCNNQLPPAAQNARSGLFPGKVWHTSQQPGSMVDSPPRGAELAMAMLPEVCREHIHRFDHALHDSPKSLSKVMVAKWTFFNDQSVTLKARINIDADKGIADLIPVDEGFDMEEWKAVAIMVCDAGEEVWDRPKVLPPGSGSQATATQARSMQQASSQQMQSALGGLSGSFGQGLLQGLSQNIFGGQGNGRS